MASPSVTGLPARFLHGRAADWIIALVFFFAGSIVGTLHMQHHAGPPKFYQEYFGVAVASGCGMGFVNVNAEPIPALQKFLAVQADSVSCDEVRKARTSAAGPWHVMHRYQMTMAGLVWRIRGKVSWSGLAPMFGILFGAATAMGYLVARLLLVRLLAAGVALVLLVSPLQLGILPLMRDYSKAPFFLAAVLLIGTIITRRFTFRQSVLVAAVGGVAIGIGFGFRTDLLVCLPPCVGALLAFAPGPLRETWKQRLASTVVFLAAFLVFALPPLRAMAEEGANAHVTLLGFAEPFDYPLGIDTPYYQWVYKYNDTHVNALVSAYTNWKSGSTRPLYTNTKVYERAGNEYLREMAKQFPADMLTRAFAAVLRILELPGNGLANKIHLDVNQQPIGIQPQLWVLRYLTVQRLVQRVTSGGAAFVLFALASLVIIAARSFRVAFCAALVVLYFSAYTVLQFSLRHIFHLEIFGWVAAAFLVQSIVTAIVAWRRREVLPDLDWRPALAAGLLLMSIPAVVLWAARSYQDARLPRLVTSYLAAPREPVPYRVVNGSSADRVLLRLDQAPPPKGEMRVDYLVVELRNSPAAGLLLFRNKPIASPVWDHARSVSVARTPSMNDAYPSDVTRYFFPAYSGPESLFEGIELARDAVPAVAGIYRLKRSPDLPLLLWMTLPADWRERPRHQRLVGADLRRTWRSFYDAPPRSETPSLDLNDLNGMTKLVRPSRAGLTVQGIVENDGSNGTYATFRPRKVKRGATFVVEGRIYYGCLFVILSAQSQFLSANPAQPGPFRVELTVPADGEYSVVLANAFCPGPNDLEITHAGWVE
jgi:hypothetical protein